MGDVGSPHLGQVPAGHDSGWLVVDADLEAGGAPVHELDGTLALDVGHGHVHVLGGDVAPVEQTHGHVFAVPGVTAHHLRRRLEARVGDL